MPNLNLPLFFISDPTGSQDRAPKRREGVKFKVFDWNNSYINFNIFGDAESKSTIIFYVRTTWRPKMGPKNGIKFEVFDWNNSYINFSIFEDAETEYCH